jgi:HPt (histidine-containing phosphotransfer) domain-containing protein/CheY-like chemotaxis protein
VKEAEQSNRLKSRILANVSHETRTPLNAIVGYSEVILKSRSIDDVHSKARGILQLSEDFLHLIDNLLDHARLEAGELTLKQAPFNLQQVLNPILAAFKQRATAKGLVFRTSVPELLEGSFLGDEERVSQIVSNLLSNAVKFTAQGVIDFSAKVLREEPSGTVISLTVQDTGIGISSERIRDVFQSFTQADDGTTRRFGGTGLGITIARRLAQLMDGDITAQSDEGKGSQFNAVIKLPRIPTTKQAVATSAPKAITGALVISPYDPSLEALMLCLEDLDIHFDVVESVDDAIALSKKEAYQAVFVDIDFIQSMHREMLGRLLVSLQDREEGPLPIVAMSIHPPASVHELADRLHACSVLQKPIRPGLVKEVLQQSAPDSEPSAPAPSEAEAPPQLMNLAEAYEEFGNNKTIVNQLIQQFFAQVNDQLPLMRKAMTDGDLEVIRRNAHKIKGGSANLTAMAVSRQALALETAAREKRTDDASIALSALERHFKKLTAWYKEQSVE